MTLLTPDAFASKEYDFLVVGGGTAGLVLSSRLSEIASVNVGVVEAGGDNSEMTEVIVPGLAGKGLNHERLDWKFKTIKQTGANDRVITCPRGKGVGGSSALNFMVYSRANACEYDAIEALGNPGWNWANFLRYMKKAETFTEPPDDIKGRYRLGTDATVHGYDGPLKISYSHWHNESHNRFLDSMVNLGVRFNEDPTGGSNTGASTGMFTIDPSLAVRTYSGSAYYQPNAERTNLHLLTDAHVTRVLLDQTDGEYVAKGVEFIRDGQKYTVYAKREVILCCGSFQSPLILELSGIGLSEVLNAHGIPQLIDLPVGENLRTRLYAYYMSVRLTHQDHGWIPFIHEVDNSTETYENLSDPHFYESQQKLYDEQRRGMLSGSFSAYAYIPLNRIMEPDMLGTFLSDVKRDTSLWGTAALQQQSNFLKKWFSDVDHPQLEVLQFPGFYSLNQSVRERMNTKRRYQTLLLMDLHPLSRGSIHISSADPAAMPNLDPGYLHNPLDVDLLMDAARFVKKLCKTAPYNEMKPMFVDPTEDTLDDDEKLRDWVRERVEPIYHPVGTCSMLPREAGGVVDPSLMVYGTKNLRVVDASILPMEMATHIQSCVYAIAEKAADIIKQKYAL
ncbi:unnamed protein product [Peniophora sp. CBMAI 1063]|nr:unnamed protein product [Peniophora sp. CBMAI 1063]